MFQFESASNVTQTPPGSTRPPRHRPKRRLPPEVLSHQEVLSLLEACDSGTATGLRNRALLAILYRAGLRINEALELRPKDLDLPHGTLRVLFGKGGRDRTVGIDAGAVPLIEAWVRAREAWDVDGRCPLLCSMSGRLLRASYIRRLLPSLAGKAGIYKKVHAHGFRHTHAAELRSEGVDIGIISKQLGHRSITTTARYLDHIAPMAVVEAVRARVWC